MSTIVSATVPAEDFVLSHTVESLPDLTFEMEQIVANGDESVMPLMWVRGASRKEAKETLEEDPTVENVTLVSDFDDEWLFRMEWIDHIDLILQMITNSKATILDALGRGDTWKLRVLYPDRDHFSKTHDFCGNHAIGFRVDSIRELQGEPAGRYGLTADQHNTLITGEKRGYFEVPREVTLEELADELGVSHQAASERLRRATSALIEDALFVGLVEDELDADDS